MIKKFLFENFKSFEKSELELEDFTTLIGTNASGKSNAIEGIKILSESVTGRELAVILDGGLNTISYIRGGSKACCRFKYDAFKLGCVIDLDEEYDLLYEIKIKITNNHTYIDEEKLYKIRNEQDDYRSGKIFKTKAPSDKDSGDIKVEYNNGRKGMNPQISCTRISSILSQMQSKMPRESECEKENGNYIDLVCNQLKNILFLNPIPSKMRNYARINDSDIRMECENVSAVLNKVCIDKENKEQLLKIINELPENNVSDIEFYPTKLGDVMFALKERYNSTANLVDARLLSDGTLRSIAMLAAAMSSNDNTMIIVEEIDNGIHPGKVTMLIDALSKIGLKSKTDILVTTHNAVLLNSYNKEKLLGVSVVYRDNLKGTSRFIPFVEIDEFPRVIAGGGLGNAMVDESLIKLIKEEKKSKDYSWLEV